MADTLDFQQIPIFGERVEKPDVRAEFASFGGNVSRDLLAFYDRFGSGVLFDYFRIGVWTRTHLDRIDLADWSTLRTDDPTVPLIDIVADGDSEVAVGIHPDHPNGFFALDFPANRYQYEESFEAALLACCTFLGNEERLEFPFFRTLSSGFNHSYVAIHWKDGERLQNLERIRRAVEHGILRVLESDGELIITHLDEKREVYMSYIESEYDCSSSTGVLHFVTAKANEDLQSAIQSHFGTLFGGEIELLRESY